jgi:hypothetical protein
MLGSIIPAPLAVPKKIYINHTEEDDGDIDDDDNNNDDDDEDNDDGDDEDGNDDSNDNDVDDDGSDDTSFHSGVILNKILILRQVIPVNVQVPSLEVYVRAFGYLYMYKYMNR